MYIAQNIVTSHCSVCDHPACICRWNVSELLLLFIEDFVLYLAVQWSCLLCSHCECFIFSRLETASVAVSRFLLMIEMKAE